MVYVFATLSDVKRSGLQLTDADRRLLAAWTRAGKTPQRIARRARIVLLLGDGRAQREVAARLGVSTRSVALWKRRFSAGGAAALVSDAPGRGRKASVTVHARTLLHALLATPPAAPRWTVRALAAAAGVSAASMHRVLKATRMTSADEAEASRRTSTAIFPEGQGGR
jgi:transposase